MPHFKRKALTVAVSAALSAMSVLPILAEAGAPPPPITYSVNGANDTAATFVNVGTIEDVEVVGAMTSVTNTGTISADIDNLNQATTQNGGQEFALLISADITTFVNSGDVVVDTTPTTGTVYKSPDQGILHINNSAAISSFINSGKINSLNGVAGALGPISGMSLDSSTITSLANQATGKIEGGNVGLTLSNSASISTLDNSGLIQGGAEGIRLSNSAISSLTNQLTGTINGGVGIRLLSSASIGTLTNKGNIQGGINLEQSTIGLITNQATGTIVGNNNGIIVSNNSTITQLTNNGQINKKILVNAGSSITHLDNAFGATISDTYNGITYRNGLTGTLGNAGTIKAAGSGSGSGIHISGGDLSGSLTNSGLISAHFTGTTSSVGAIGIKAESSLVSGSITIKNSGSITANALITSPADTSAEASARGILIGDLTGSISIENGGTITATATASAGTSGANANGVFVNSLMAAGSLINDGTITARANVTGDAGNASNADGIKINTLDGSIINNNAIVAEAHATNLVGSSGGAFASGIVVGTFNATGNITNTDSITVTVDAATASSVIAWGIGFSSNAMNGTLDNQGDIVVTATGSASASAIGIMSDSIANPVTATWTNSGIINVIGHGNAAAEGVRIGSFDGLFNNSGSISAIDAIDHNLAINITNGSGTFNNLYGGLVAGDIEIGGTVAVTNAGTLSLPSSAVGHIAGDYTQTATGLFRIGADSNSAFGQLLVSGTATLVGTANVDVDVNAVNTLANGQVLASILSAGALNSDGTFNVTDNSSIFNFSGSLNGALTAVDLTVEKGVTVSNAVAFSGLPAGVGAATVFDDLIDNGGGTMAMNDVITELGQLETEQEVADAVESTLPGISGGVAQMTVTMAKEVTGVIASRQNQTRGLSSGDGFIADRHVWFKPFGNWTDQDDRDGVAGYDIDSYGLAFGVDGDITSTWNAGFAFAYIDSEVGSNLAAGSHKIDVDSYLAKAYATAMLDDVTAVNIQAGVGISNYDSKRRIFTGDVADADYGSWSAQLNAELERSYQMSEQTVLTPYVYADYSYVDVDSYHEKGAGALNLDVNDDSADSLVLGTGVKAHFAASENLLLIAEAGVGYDLMADRSSLTSSYAGSGTQFSTLGIDPDEMVYNANLGVEFNLDNGTEITVSYDIDSREDYTDQSMSVNFRVPF